MARVTSILLDDARSAARQFATRLSPLSGTTVVVAGAGGFLGGWFLDLLTAYNALGQAKPVSILAIDNFQTGVPDRLEHLVNDPNVWLVEHDLRQPFKTTDRIDWILHAASIASPTFYRRFPLETIDVNVQGTRRLLEWARTSPVKGFLYLSSSEIYGDPDPEFIPTPEDYRGYVSATGPRACYDESKRLAETLCVTYHRLYETPVSIARPFNVYGPGQRLDDRRIIPDLMSHALQKKPLVLHSDGRATRSFCYALEAAVGMILLMIEGERGEAYNVGHDEEVSIAQVARIVSELADVPVEFQQSNDRDYLVDNPERRCPDLTKLTQRLGIRPQLPLREGLARTLASYRESATRSEGARS